MSIASYLFAVVSFFIFAILFIILLRLSLPFGWFILELLLGIFVHVCSAFAGPLLISSFSYWYYSALYAFLWFCFFFVTSIYSASVSVGIISFLYRQPGYKASIGDIYQTCIVSSFMERAEFLVSTNQAIKTENGYLATQSGRKTVYFFRLIQKIFGMQGRGFYASKADLETGGFESGKKKL